MTCCAIDVLHSRLCKLSAYRGFDYLQSYSIPAWTGITLGRVSLSSLKYVAYSFEILLGNVCVNTFKGYKFIIAQG